MINRVLIYCIFFALGGPATGFGSPLAQDGVQSIQISPDGKNVAVFTRRLNVDQLQVVNIDNKETVFYRDSQPPGRFASFTWLNADSFALVHGRNVENQISPIATGVIELYSLNGTTRQLSDIVPQSSGSDYQYRIVDGLPNSNAMVIENSSSKILSILDIQADQLEEIQYPPIDIDQVLVSPNMRFILIVGVNGEGEKRVMTFEYGVSEDWSYMDPDLKPLAVDNTGIVTSVIQNQSGMVSTSATDLMSETQSIIFEDDKFDTDRVLFDSDGSPFAIRYLPGYPSWIYVGENYPLINLHKNLRAALPKGDITFVSSTADGLVWIAKVEYEDRPPHYHLVRMANGQAPRLLASETGLFIAGGEEGIRYSMQPFSIRDEHDVYGLISLPEDGAHEPRPMVVMLKDKPENVQWRWGYNTDVAYFNRLGFNVLLVNHRGSAGYGAKFAASDVTAAVTDVRAAIIWAIESGFTENDRICTLGRGSGSEIAILAAMQSDFVSCVVSIGGLGELSLYVGGNDEEALQSVEDLSAFFIYGENESESYMESQRQTELMLHSRGADTYQLTIAGETRVISSQSNEVDSLSSVASFLQEKIGNRGSWLPLPMTYDQAVALNNLLTELGQRRERFEPGSRARLDPVAWLEKQNAVMHRSFSEFQWPLYMSLKAQLFDGTPAAIAPYNMPNSVPRNWPPPSIKQLQ